MTPSPATTSAQTSDAELAKEAPNPKLPCALTRLTVAGFRRHRDSRTFSFIGPNGQPLPVIVAAGTNGSGKTALLEALILAVGHQDALVAARAPLWRQTVPEGATLSVEGWQGGEQLRAEGAPSAHVIKRLAYVSSWRAPELVGAIEPAPTPSGSPAVTEANRLWRLKRRILNARSRMAFESGSDAALPWLERLNRAWSGFHGDAGRIDTGLVDQADGGTLADLFLFRGVDRICPIDDLSSGELELLSLFTLALFDDFDKGGIVVIDEPELHLHPRWQSTLIPALQNLLPSVQLIVASHSDYIWDAVPSYARIML